MYHEGPYLTLPTGSPVRIFRICCTKIRCNIIVPSVSRSPKISFRGNVQLKTESRAAHLKEKLFCWKTADDGAGLFALRTLHTESISQ
jgi:hypothetical protein